jgi:hypothetical protein
MDKKHYDDGNLLSICRPETRARILAEIAKSHAIIAAKCKIIKQGDTWFVPEDQRPQLAPPPQEQNRYVERMFADNGTTMSTSNTFETLDKRYVDAQGKRKRGQSTRLRDRPSSLET